MEVYLQEEKMAYKSDIEIAQENEKKDIKEIAEKAGINEKYLELYGNHKAKINYSLLEEMKNREDGKLILVTAISPTPA
jgi:formate--tetrahydrofolate ligase